MVSFNKPYTLEGLEPGPSVPEVDATSAAPRRQGCFCHGGVAQRTSHPPQEREDPGSNPALFKENRAVLCIK
jgi:hypothetical protein